MGTKLVSTQKMFSQGDFQVTNNPLDMAISGDGFFQVTMPDGTIGYTRSGSFNVDSTGKLVTSDGYAVQPVVTIPADATQVNIESD